MAQTIQAGVAHLIVPHVYDQPDNAVRIERLGLGKSIYPERYRSDRVAGLLGKLCSDSNLAMRRKDFAARIDSDAALDKACGLIEGLAAK